MITCSDAVKQLWEYLDATVDADSRDAIEEHLSHCRRCCGELEFATELRRFLAGSRHDDVPEDVRARLHRTLEELGP